MWKVTIFIENALYTNEWLLVLPRLITIYRTVFSDDESHILVWYLNKTWRSWFEIAECAKWLNTNIVTFFMRRILTDGCDGVSGPASVRTHSTTCCQHDARRPNIRSEQHRRRWMWAELRMLPPLPHAPGAIPECSLWVFVVRTPSWPSGCLGDSTAMSWSARQVTDEEARWTLM